MKVLKHISCVIIVLIALAMSGCSSTRHLPTGTYLLDDVKIRLNDSTGTLNETEMMTYVRHQENNRMLWSAKLRLGVYNMSGKDTTKWWNRWIRKLGEPPVVFDYANSLSDAEQLRKAMINDGFLKASVSIDTIANHKKRKMKVYYNLHPGVPYVIRNIDYVFPNDTLKTLVMRDSSRMIVGLGDMLNRSDLEAERELITNRLKNRGYYAFGKEYITFNADTTAGSNEVDLTMTLNPPYPAENRTLPIDTHKEYIVRNVTYIMDYDPGVTEDLVNFEANDTVSFKGITILYGKSRYLRPGVLAENCFITPGQPYRLRNVNKTYSALSRLPILKFINIRFLPVGSGHSDSPVGFVDAYILLTKGKSQTFSVELEGTNSEGDLGVAAGINYSHRNIAKGSETLSGKLHGSYESLSGNLSGLLHNRYMEYGIEVGINFPKFKAPFLKESFKRRIMAATEFNISMNYQERPEYTRIISTAGWSYKWSEHNNRDRHTLTPIDVNYVYLPESTNDFINQIAPDNPLLRYSYEDHFIMRLGYNFYHTNKRQDRPWRMAQKDIFTIRLNAEVAGNLLFALNSVFNHRSDFHSNPYRVFGIRYSQYAKMEADLSFLHIFNERNALAWHTGFGIGVPYGNSSMLPFEKRFYGGGANGVRGWDVRTLGPGRYPGSNSVSDFINQCGDIRIELSAEYRAKLFWVLESALFVDAGNIWTIRNYVNQPYGMFHFNSFYKEIAAAYGVGLRFDFSYFLLRFDMGMKAHNPAINAEPWPLIHPKWSRDHSFHFSIGYPF